MKICNLAQMGTYNRCVKIDLKFSSVCEKMSENRRPRGDFFDSHCRWKWRRELTISEHGI